MTHILQTAQVLFAQFGLKKVTTDDVAREAQVSKATIYKYFKNKAENLDEVVRIESDQLLSAIRNAVDSQETVTEKLRAHLLTRLSTANDFVNFYRVTQESWGDFWPYIARVRYQFLTAEMDIVSAILQRGIHAGELRIKQATPAAQALVVALASVEFQWALDEQGVALTTLVDTMMDMMTNGIKKR